MTSQEFDLTVPIAPREWLDIPDLSKWNWDSVPPLSPFIHANHSGLARQQTVTRVCANRHGLYVRFDCDDQDIWGTYTERDEPIYDEEAVEVFIGQGIDDPVHYYEFEVSPNGVLLDADVYNPTSERATMKVDFDWDCEDIQWSATRHDAENHWSAVLVIPWRSITSDDELPRVWRANFYRIERPREGEPEFSCWSPTMVVPTDFHKPAYFGILRLSDF